MSNFNKLIAVNRAPQDTKMIGVYDSSGNVKGYIKAGVYQVSSKTNPLYKFAIMSDVHNLPSGADYGTGYIQSQCTEDFGRALDFVKDSVDFTCVCGDLTVRGKVSEAETYRDTIKNNCGGKPVYACGGNHETYEKGWGESTDYLMHPDNWAKYTGMAPSSSREAWSTYTGIADNTNIEVCPSMPANTYFTKTHGNTVDHFVFLSIETSDWNQTDKGMSTAYSSASLTWLENILQTADQNSQKCFVFLHLFFPGKSGNYGGLYLDGHAELGLSGTPLNKLTTLCNTYKKSYWFSGHSHWMWEMQGVLDKEGRDNKDANVYPTTNYSRSNYGGWCVHIPSCGSPRHAEPGADSYDGDDTGTLSQFAIVEVYSDGIRVKGVSLCDRETEPIAGTDPVQYRAKHGKEGTFKYVPVADYVLMAAPNVSDVTSSSSTSISIGNSITNSSGTQISYDKETNKVTAIARQYSQNPGSFSIGYYSGGVDDKDMYSSVTVNLSSQPLPPIDERELYLVVLGDEYSSGWQHVVYVDGVKRWQDRVQEDNYYAGPYFIPATLDGIHSIIINYSSGDKDWPDYSESSSTVSSCAEIYDTDNRKLSNEESYTGFFAINGTITVHIKH